MSEYHPKTEVSFAPTKVFTSKYGMAEAEVQRKKFERPTWASVPPPNLEKCETAHTEKKDLPEPPFLFMAFALGFFCGMAITWIAVKH